MANTPLIVGLVFFGLAVVYFLFGKQRSRGYDADIVRGESILINETDGVCYVTGAIPLDKGKAQYRLLTGEKKEVKRVYADNELLDFSKVLNVVSRPLFITMAAVAALSGKIDVSALKKNFDTLRTEFDELQAVYLALKNNKESEIDKGFERAREVLKAVPRPKGRMT